ncbi:SusD/RagB family nutrient-binding outer membrane lipoprotein [Sphingobacterium corticibacter]|uniref:SusD/RagB family nutrient-binding outer membrane lipoprotein n=1 Tax=Sphingobacterium corticibacter TaxID=2171749 RepID=UPI001A9CAE39|nr:SusD/RagB family nutrient-binding outer membrane lipoprotein [Sphingobacterium corticibacter]
MKITIKKGMMGMLASLALFSSCNDFEALNIDPNGANDQQVQVEYLLNGSIIGAQQDPHIAERVFVLYWKTAGRQQLGGGIVNGAHNDGWSSDYYSRGYMSGWLSGVYAAVDLANERIAAGTQAPYTNNLLQVARIWRAYLLSELSDTFGPVPLDGWQGENPSYSSVQEVYSYLLTELREASEALDMAVTVPADIRRFDPAYGYDFAKWQKYANSMRMRLAMRMSEVDAAKARSEFEAAATKPYITAADDMFSVAELGTAYSPLAGVMTRTWNAFILSSTLNNLYLGLGGITTQTALGASYNDYVKPADYIGIYYPNHFATATNDPSAGYWLDGLPAVIDPRAYASFAIPGDFNNAQFNFNPDQTTARNTTRNLLNADGTTTFKTINAAFTWNAFAPGDWAAKGSRNQVRSWAGSMPRLVNKFRDGNNRRVFFANWESNFLIAEAAVRGWAVPMSAQAAYEAGVTANFSYWGLSAHAANYLTSTGYNRVGTSVAWTHTTEPGNTHAMQFVNGETGTTGTVQIRYPSNGLYRDGAIRNDQLTKIITQKFIAQNPYLPLETWSDHRRLGLPFFENPAVEQPIVTLPDLTASNFMTSSVKFFPQRVNYPSTLRNTNEAGYNQAVSALGGPDAVLTPLWWAKQQ